MICRKCAGEKFNVIRVQRHAVRRDKGWLWSNDVDSRIILCEECGSRYLTETRIVEEIQYDFTQMKQLEIPFDDRLPVNSNHDEMAGTE